MNKAQRITIAVTLVIMVILSAFWDTWGSDGVVIRHALEFIRNALVALFLGGAVFTFFSLKKKETK